MKAITDIAFYFRIIEFLSDNSSVVTGYLHDVRLTLCINQNAGRKCGYPALMKVMNSKPKHENSLVRMASNGWLWELVMNLE
jgi:hypothetical protein